ncbi:hypothetical protein HYPSUDRAFT_133611 [Hypholoma sublateritium FD-334 SS-4]|uniref:Rho-GAP domain-containing protein n=1 Tax=Hypholoma sublateritium (strain FD-334 SS-4) TaxID=945553 RepID=A0A0D2LF15_HYPSF|nr:hypothetical protein HYPSUDRAFT_133611 [Hypholoma sublateritium FD-334 SS-4]
MVPASFNLKQRLTALSLAQSSPSDPSHPPPPITPNGKRKFFSTPNWIKKAQEEGGVFNRERDIEPMYRDEEKRLAQDVMSKMIFQAGVDFEYVLICLFNASALPDPQLVSYDLLLARILSYLNLYVEADYTVVFFAAGTKYAPSWNWVWKTYRSLSRKYRKNLKQLYIVHSSFFSKMLFSLAGAIISPKFFRKIVYITTLSELAKRVPLTQIDIPPAVYQENLKYERKISLPMPTRSSLFGVPLVDIMGYNGEKGGIPRVVKDAIQYLRETAGLQEEGLFRRSPSSSLLRAAQEAYDRGNVVSLENFADPHLAAVLLKKYLRDLPEPIFPESMYGAIRQCPLPSGGCGVEENDMASIQFVREVLLADLVPCAYILLSHVLHLLHEVSLRSDYNRMDATNLAIVICPNLVKSANPMRDVMMCAVPVSENNIPSQSSPMPSHSRLLQDGGGRTTLGMVISLCIRRYYEIFDEVVDRTEAVVPWHPLEENGSANSPTQATYVLGDEDDLDDEMSIPTTVKGASHVPPIYHYTTKRHRSAASHASDVASSQSVYNDNSSSSSLPRTNGGTFRSSTHSRARSLFSAEQSKMSTAITEKGTIAVGRGTMRKGSGAAVEAVGVIAEGFFSSPSGAPPLPKRPVFSTTTQPEVTNQLDQEEHRVSVSERKQLFEQNR